ISVPQYAGTHPLVARITRLRARVRFVVALFGTGLLITAGIGGLFLLMLADYLIHMPPSVRLLLLIATVIVLSILAWRILISPMPTRLTDQFLASRVENFTKNLADELMSALFFIHSRAGASNALAARPIDQAAQNAAGIRFEDAVDFRPAAKSLGI